MASERNAKNEKKDSKHLTAKELAQRFDFSSFQGAKEAAKSLLNDYQKTNNTTKRKQIRKATKKAALAAARHSKEKPAHVYKVAAQHMQQTTKENKTDSSERNSSEGKKRKSNKGNDREFYSDYHAYVSHRMNDFTAHERRNGKAMQKIAQEWQQWKEN
ncbi:MAG: hypothetical protein SVV03_05890 [Candidatus Nanohaloarchaea archaeon]|nr:hypothetical protein [Candidatus Nanohaloarchaea archaeon]